MRRSLAARFVHRAALGLAIVLGAAFRPSVVSGQSSISDSEVVPAGGVSVQVQYMRVPSSAGDRGWTLFAVSNSFGLKHGLEVSAGSSWIPGDDIQPLSAVAGWKWRLLSDEQGPVAIAVGGTSFLPLGRGTSAPWGMLFGTVERSFGAHAPSAAIGAYTLIGRREASDSRRGILLSVAEQVSPDLEFSIEWVSGKNWFGYLSPGATLTRGEYSVWIGYSRGTDPRGNSGPSASFGLDF